MRVATKRWGEITIKEQGLNGKNKFDKTKSFSVDETSNNYSLLEYWQILKIVTNLTGDYSFRTLKKKLEKLQRGEKNVS